VTLRFHNGLAAAALTLAALSSNAVPAQDPTAAGDDFAREVVPFIARYCAECHSPTDEEENLVLTRVLSGSQVRAAAETWEDVLAVLDLHDMPPKDASQPDAHERARVVELLEGVLAAGGVREAGGLRRLNAAEYTRTVRDLFGVEFDARAHFPPDGIGHGFDTVAESLTLSDLAVEMYLSAAESIAADAVAVDLSAFPSKVRLSGEQLRGPGFAEAKILSTHGAIEGTFEIPYAGRYRLSTAVAASQAGDEFARMAIVCDQQRLAESSVGATPARAKAGHPDRPSVEVQLDRGAHRVGVRFLNDYYDPEHPDPTRRDRNLHVYWIELEGPLDAPPPTDFQLALTQRVGPDGQPEGEASRLAYLVHRIWRRPAQPSEIERLKAMPDPEASADLRLRWQLTALLTSPHFIFRLEPDPPGAADGERRPLVDDELAVRLSYFLWGTTPDEELQQAANLGELSDAGKYRDWVQRLVDDPRSRSFSRSFSSHWLQIQGHRLVQGADAKSESLRQAMAEESALFFDTILRGNLSLWQLLEADWTLANQVLAEVYGVPDVTGEEHQRVSLASTQRRGVLGQAAVLARTSEATRTSPVRRGKWVLEALLGAAPTAAPALPNPLEEADPLAPNLSLRERWAAHRQDPACALCHDSMDPIGFGLENYGPQGRWRSDYPIEPGSNGEPEPVDGSGELMGGRPFDGPLGLVQALRADDRFQRTLTEKLLTYALGRGMTAADRGLVERIGSALDADEPSLRQLVIEIACSEAFTHRQVGGQR